ncbi:hypothetical protein FHW58_003010 [Duganella sp. 1224]|uniref:hypothetical protein n=1 Tax=Duganella sp. 1224 TaxID=2587052 RepID=UPI0015CC01FC|nr:hypothetical protein [Duganella sp. 1224]NYE61803.1 hypothetical protein [Duganella sp. 1224]
MAINITSTSNANPLQLNLRETRANRVEQRSEQAAETRRSDTARRAEKDDAVLQQRVKQNSEATRNEARANDQAVADRRGSEKTLGRNIDTTA